MMNCILLEDRRQEFGERKGVEVVSLQQPWQTGALGIEMEILF
ncbi:hypothetical protein [Gelatiniphilus marinus]|uniref:Uncharacterized protein n=1 Tax=Gelatiniphilus marinus TaxID=1759464 RepID=A0ABW5JVK9_9FLAO